MKEEQIFLAALDLSNPDARTAYLEMACGDDTDLREVIDGLLESHFRTGEFLDVPVAEQLKTGVPEAKTDHFPIGPNQDGQNPNQMAAEYFFLGPSSRPNSLGRLSHYEILEVLGKGGFGIVFRAFDETLERIVAVKVLAPQLAACPRARKRFLREAQSSAKVRHENVVHVYGVEEQPLPFIVMEFIPGVTLKQKVARHGPLEIREVLLIGSQIAEGLAAAHAQGLIHRDIKPGNILIDDARYPLIKITDFGLARAADDASLSNSKILAGTPMYMSPEQANGGPLDHRADLFSLGSVLYTMCTGKAPFGADNTLAVIKRVAESPPSPIQEIVPGVPHWLCEIISRLHAKKPENRFGSAKEVADLLKQGLGANVSPENFGLVPGFGPLATMPANRGNPSARGLRIAGFEPRTWVAGIYLTLLLLFGLGFTEASGVTDLRGTIIRLLSPVGTLVVEIDDPGVSVKLDGSEIVITGAGPREIRLKPGSYTVEASKNGQVLKRELVSVTQNGRRVVRISQEPTTDAPTMVKEPDRRAAEYALSIGAGIRINDENRERTSAGFPVEPFRLTWVSFVLNTRVTDEGLAHFKGCKNIKSLFLGSTAVGDAGLANFQDCNDLNYLDISATRITDQGLGFFNDYKKLEVLDFDSTGVSDSGLLNFKGCRNLRHVNLRGSKVSDAGIAWLANNQGLVSIQLDGVTQITDKSVPVLKGLKKLKDLQVQRTSLSNSGIKELKSALPNCKILSLAHEDHLAKSKPLNDADWEKSIEKMSPSAQIKAFQARMQELNPGFDGTVNHYVKNGFISYLDFETKNVVDITPVKAFKKLNIIRCWGNRNDYSQQGMLTDLSPLKGLPIEELYIITSPISDLTPLKGMELRSINVERTQVTDLSPLQGMPLSYVNLYFTPIADLKPLHGMPLKYLQIMGTRVTDLSPLKNLPIENLYCVSSKVSDLSPLKGMPLTTLACDHTQVSDLSPLKGIPIKVLGLGSTRITDLAPLKGMPLVDLNISETKVTDLSPLKEMPLEILVCSFNSKRDAGILKSISTLKQINLKPVDQFWKEMGK